MIHFWRQKRAVLFSFVTLFLPWLVEASAWSCSLLLGDLGLLHSDRLAKIRRSAKVVWVTVGPSEGGL